MTKLNGLLVMAWVLFKWLRVLMAKIKRVKIEMNHERNHKKIRDIYKEAMSNGSFFMPVNNKRLSEHQHDGREKKGSGSRNRSGCR